MVISAQWSHMCYKLQDALQLIWHLGNSYRHSHIATHSARSNYCYKLLGKLLLGFTLCPEQNTLHVQVCEPTSRISLFAFGDVASLKTLMATGIFTSSPSGTHRPCVKTSLLFNMLQLHLNHHQNHVSTYGCVPRNSNYVTNAAKKCMCRTSATF